MSLRRIPSWISKLLKSKQAIKKAAPGGAANRMKKELYEFEIFLFSY